MQTRSLRLPVLSLVPSMLLVAACASDPPPAATDATAVTASHSTSPPAAVATPSGSAMLTVTPGSHSQKAERRTAGAWVPCHATFKPDPAVDLATSVDQMAKGCQDTTQMHLLSSFKGTQSAANLPQSFAFAAAANHCYRAYGVAGPGIQDLDLLIKDSTGAVAGEDSTDDPTPVVLEQGAVCFNTADSATVVVSIGAGSGAYAVEVWGD